MNIKGTHVNIKMEKDTEMRNERKLSETLTTNV